MMTTDCGGSNGARVRLWKVELQKLADETGLEIAVCHYPPGTSQWNRIEHRLFCHITQNSYCWSLGEIGVLRRGTPSRREVMSMRTSAIEPVPEETARIARAAFC